MQEHSNFFIKSERTVIVMLGCAPPRRAAVVPHRRHSHFNQAAVAPVRLLSPSLCSRCFERTSGAIRNGDLKLDRRSLLRSLCVHSSLGMQRRRRRQSSPSRPPPDSAAAPISTDRISRAKIAISPPIDSYFSIH